MAIKTLFTILSLIFGFLTFLPYFVEMFKGKASPHIFSWVTWGLIGFLSFIISLTHGGGGGAWISGLQAFLCFFVVAYAFFKGEKNITRVDKISFIAAMVVSIFYLFTKQAVPSIILAVTIDLLGFVPTFRKSYLKPLEEPVLTYASSAVSYSLSVGAIAGYSFVTLLNPLTLAVANILLVIFLLIRRTNLR